MQHDAHLAAERLPVKFELLKSSEDELSEETPSSKIHGQVHACNLHQFFFYFLFFPPTFRNTKIKIHSQSIYRWPYSQVHLPLPLLRESQPVLFHTFLSDSSVLLLCGWHSPRTI